MMAPTPFASAEPRIDPVEGNRLSVENPATGEILATLPLDGSDAVDRAVQAARIAFEQGDWRRKSPDERATVLRRAADAIEREADTLSRTLVAETGLPLTQVAHLHIPRTAANFRFFADNNLVPDGTTHLVPGRHLSLVTREPVGVVGLIAPWNAPTVLASIKLSSALILGNSVVVKPSEHAPLAVARLVAILHESGVPEGALHCVHGPGQPTGQAVVAHPDVAAISFIGGTGTGRAILAAAAPGLKKVGLELGGKNASIVLADCDIDKAIANHMITMFAGNAEQCLSASRILVEDAVADRFLNALAQQTKALVVGDPMDPNTEVGPLAFAAHWDRAEHFAEQARTGAGYRVLAEATLPADGGSGFYFAPMMVEADGNDRSLCQEEIFAPIVMVQRVRDLADAIARANDSDYGLAAYLWTRDIDAVARARRDLRVGTLWVNTVMARDLRAPFGGFKSSGLGRDGLAGLLDLFTEEKTTMLAEPAF